MCCDLGRSVLEAVDSFLGGAHCLVVPLRERWRRAGSAELSLCWLTVEDVARFFLSSIGLFSPTASRSITELGVVRPATLAVVAGDRALSTLPLLRDAMASHTAVAVVPSLIPRRRLVGEISPSALCSCGVSAAAAIAALSAGDLLGFIGRGGAPPEAALHAVRSRLRRRNLIGMLDLLYGVDPSSSSSSSASSSSSSSSDDDDDDERSCLASPCSRGSDRGLFSGARATGRRAAEEAIVCRRGSSLVAVMVQAMAHRATHVWVVDEREGEERELVGVVGLPDVLRVLRYHLQQPLLPPISGQPDGHMNQAGGL
ncbi:CBS domain-containing protein CBSX5-like [Panicum virgatum]|uniref:CBS domain-containing protein n=1 Tax=Panicum virgatum TaxID=38727 RepID=A0A8T0Q8W2_PANVG|nr:CBS domain-containing protein CBSX5-like [Panicum virgatum]KAG2569825.1 hypothetical protein PVAP13_7NG442600 [Panicum virgatum]